VEFHLLELVLSELAGFVEDVSRDADFADVVEESAGLEGLDFEGVEAEEFAETTSEQFDALDVVVSDVVFGIDGHGEHFEDGVIDGGDLVVMTFLFTEFVSICLEGIVDRNYYR
jgi:hypothetical protein